MVKASVDPATRGFDGKVLCDFAQKVPPIAKRSGDPARDKVALRQRVCLQHIIDRCLKDPRYILPLHAELVTMFVDTPEDTGDWTGEYKTVERLPRSWKAAFLLAEAARTKCAVVTKDLLSKIAEDDPDNIAALFSYVVQLPGSLAMPPQCSHSTVCSKAMVARASQVGNRLTQFATAGGFATDGRLDWMKAGVFRLQFTDGVCTLIEHSTGAIAVPPEHVKITTAYTLHNNFLDYRAEVVLKPNVYKLHELFPDDAPFKLSMFFAGRKWKAFATTAKEVHDAMVAAEETKEQDTVKADMEVLQSAADMRLKRSLEKARTLAADKRKERETKRVLKLS